MEFIEDNSIDLLVTDPPYKMNHSTGGCTNIGFKNKWQGNIKAGNTVMGFNTDLKFKEWLSDAYRVLKDGSHAYIFINDKNIYEMIRDSQNVGFILTNVLVWRKNNCTPNRCYMKDCEFILFLRKGKAVPINNMSSKTVLEYRNINGKDKRHPTEKPVDLLELLIINSTKENDVVLDLFMGCGSTGEATKNTKRRFIGIELDNTYFKIAEERIKST